MSGVSDDLEHWISAKGDQFPLKNIFSLHFFLYEIESSAVWIIMACHYSGVTRSTVAARTLHWIGATIYYASTGITLIHTPDIISIAKSKSAVQTPRNLLGFHRTEDRFWPDFADIKHDYTQQFYRSYSSFISQCPRTGKFHGVWQYLQCIGNGDPAVLP